MGFEYAERQPGVYQAVFTQVKETTIPDGDGTKAMWLWEFQEVDDDSSTGFIDGMTSPGYKPRSNGLKYITGLLGHAPGPGDDPTKLYGKTVQVIYGPNQNGRLTITDILPMKAGK